MKMTELRLGNWVMYNNQIVKVTGLHYGMFECGNLDDENWMCTGRLSKVQPIKLTEEVLVKIGFEDRKEYFNYSQVFGDDGDYCDSIYIYYCPRLNHFKFTHNIVENLDLQTMDLYNIKYLHQLQNVYHSLTGKELNIEL